MCYNQDKNVTYLKRNNNISSNPKEFKRNLLPRLKLIRLL